MMTMTATLSLLLPAFLAVQGPDLAEIVEQSECAARIMVTERAEILTATVAGVRVRADVTMVLWGACPRTIELFYARSACGDRIGGEDLVVGVTLPNNAQREYLGLETGTYLLCGALPATDELCAALGNLKGGHGTDTLLAMLDRERQGDARVRRQAFRQLSHVLSAQPDANAFAPLVPFAEKEDDAELAAAYLATFGETRCAAATGFVVRTLLAAENPAVADGATNAFPKLATPEAVRELSAQYERVRLETKARILDAVAPCELPDAQALLDHALGVEETVVPALKALQSTGRRLPTALPYVHDPVRRQRMHALVESPSTPASGADALRQRRG